DTILFQRYFLLIICTSTGSSQALYHKTLFLTTSGSYKQVINSLMRLLIFQVFSIIMAV
ncbi:hypothetical protein L9F63_012547, partial [Diploptera punctata]